MSIHYLHFHNAVYTTDASAIGETYDRLEKGFSIYVNVNDISSYATLSPGPKPCVWISMKNGDIIAAETTIQDVRDGLVEAQNRLDERAKMVRR